MKPEVLKALLRKNTEEYHASSVRQRVVTSHRNKQDLTAQQTKKLLT